jgi:hypothetical protein
VCTSWISFVVNLPKLAWSGCPGGRWLTIIAVASLVGTKAAAATTPFFLLHSTMLALLNYQEDSLHPQTKGQEQELVELGPNLFFSRSKQPCKLLLVGLVTHHPPPTTQHKNLSTCRFSCLSLHVQMYQALYLSIQPITGARVC